VGVIGTTLVTVVGWLAHAKLLAKHALLDTVVVLIISGLLVSALLDFGRGRGQMTEVLTTTPESNSFVDDTPAATQLAAREVHQDEEKPSEKGIRGLFSDAMTKLTIVADVAVGLLLGAFLTLRSDDDFAGW